MNVYPVHVFMEFVMTEMMAMCASVKKVGMVSTVILVSFVFNSMKHYLNPLLKLNLLFYLVNNYQRNT